MAGPARAAWAAVESLMFTRFTRLGNVGGRFTPVRSILRYPQAFGAVADGVTDATAAIQAAVDDALDGYLLVLAGGTFLTSATILIDKRLRIVGDATVRAATGFTGSAMFRVLGPGGDFAAFDGGGELTIDQDHRIVSGDSIELSACAGVSITGLVSRNTQRSCVHIGDDVIDLVIADVDHTGHGFGVLANTRSGVRRITILDSTFAQVGGANGDGVELIGTSGDPADQVTIERCTARGFLGEAANTGLGFGFERGTNVTLRDNLAEQCESDGFHLEKGSDDALLEDNTARDCGAGAGGVNGNGIVIYQSDRATIRGNLVEDVAKHGIALVATTETRPQGSTVAQNQVLGCGRDGIHFTAQDAATVDDNHVADPSAEAADTYAGIHLGRQGVLTENKGVTGTGNTFDFAGPTSPAAEVLVRLESIDCNVNGVTGSGSEPDPNFSPAPLIVLAAARRRKEPSSDGFFCTDGTGFTDASLMPLEEVA